MTNPTPLFIIKHYPDTWFRRILGFFVPRLGPTKYGVIDFSPNGDIVGESGVIETTSDCSMKDVIEHVERATRWQCWGAK